MSANDQRILSVKLAGCHSQIASDDAFLAANNTRAFLVSSFGLILVAVSVLCAYLIFRFRFDLRSVSLSACVQTWLVVLVWSPAHPGWSDA